MSADVSEAQTKKPGKKSKLVLILAVVVLLAGAGGGAGWWFFLRGHDGGKEARVEEKKPPKKPIFVPLDAFTVNLQDGRGERMAQIGVTLQVDDPAFEAELKDRLPAVRNAILLLISSRRAEELLTDEGKKDLALQIRTRAGQALSPVTAASGKEPSKDGGKAVVAANPVHEVLFSQFIVQ